VTPLFWVGLALTAYALTRLYFRYRKDKKDRRLP